MAITEWTEGEEMAAFVTSCRKHEDLENQLLVLGKHNP